MNKFKKKHAIFDLADTILTMAVSRERIAQDILLENGFSVSASQIKTAFRIVEKLSPVPSGKKEDEKSLRDFYYSRNEAFFEELGIFKSRAPLAAQLYKKIKSEKKWQVTQDFLTYSRFLRENDIKIGIISNWDKSFPSVLIEHGLNRITDYFESSFDIGYEKPDIRIFEAVFKKHSINRKEAFYIGNDYVMDMIPCHKLGIDSVLIDRGGDYSHADCRTVRELTELMV